MNFNAAFDLLETIQGSKSKNTAAQCRGILKHLRPFFGEMPLAPFEKDFEETWAAYVSHVNGRWKLAHDRRYLTMALKRAHRKGWIGRAFIKSDFALKESHAPIGRALDDLEVQRLLNALKRWPKAYLQALMALTMGMRRSEILALRWEEVDLERAEIHLDPSRLKTRQPRKVPIPIHERVLPLLNALRGGGGTVYVFPSVVRGVVNQDKPMRDHSYHWTKARYIAGVQCRFHDLRHTSISNHLADGMTVMDAVKIFGATPQVIEKVYFHVRKDSADAFRKRMSNKFFEEAA